MPNFPERNARLRSDARWKRSTAEAFEDQLRVALIQPGDSVIINKEAVIHAIRQAEAGYGEKGGTAVQKDFDSPLAMMDELLQGRFLF